MSAASPQPNVAASPAANRLPFELWCLVALTGAASGVTAGLLMKLLRLVQHTAWRYESGSFLDAVKHASMTMRLLVLLGAGLLVACVLPLIGKLKSERPGEVEATIWFRDGHLAPANTLAKAVFSIVVVGLGTSLGREAAPKQAGALIGDLLATWRAIAGPQRRLLAACGAGAGIAAVYNVPFGGALFALEVLLGTLALPLVAPVLLATLTGTATGWLLLPNEPTYHVPNTPLTVGLALFAIGLAPVAGVASALFVKLIAAAARLRPKGWWLLPSAVIVFGLLGAAAIPYPLLLGNGKDIVELATVDQLALPALVALLVLKPLATAACLGTGAPGGLFTPTLAFGALLGGTLGHLAHGLWPDVPIGASALVGAGAVLAATTKGPVSALVLMLELTRTLDGSMVPMLIAIAGAVTIANRIDARSTYTGRLGASALEIPDGSTSAATPYAELVPKLLAADEPIRIRDATGREIGTISRADLVATAPRLLPVEIATAFDVVEAKERSRPT